jgi:hypothetical protein
MAIVVQAHDLESGNNPLDTVIIEVPPVQTLMQQIQISHEGKKFFTSSTIQF